MTNVEEVESPTPFLSDKLYNYMKEFVQLWLPAFATLYFTLGTMYDFPDPEKVVAACAALATFLGTVLRISNRSYVNSGAGQVGTINVSNPTPDSIVYSFDLDGDPADIANKDSVTFKVINDN